MCALLHFDNKRWPVQLLLPHRPTGCGGCLIEAAGRAHHLRLCNQQTRDAPLHGDRIPCTACLPVDDSKVIARTVIACFDACPSCALWRARFHHQKACIPSPLFFLLLLLLCRAGFLLQHIRPTTHPAKAVVTHLTQHNSLWKRRCCKPGRVVPKQ